MLWRAGEKHGQGKYTFATGDVYEGEWAEGKMHGRGKYSYASGNVYEGEWAEEKKHGKGTFTYASGAVEVGWARLLRGERRRGAGRQMERGPGDGVGAAGRQGGPHHPAGRGGHDRQADRAAAALRQCTRP